VCLGLAVALSMHRRPEDDVTSLDMSWPVLIFKNFSGGTENSEKERYPPIRTGSSIESATCSIRNVHAQEQKLIANTGLTYLMIDESATV